MKILIIISIFCIVALYYLYQTEGFENPIDPVLQKKYSAFVAFYNPFLINWEKAIVTSIGLDTPVKELTDPSQVGSGSAFKGPTRAEMNMYIQKLEKTLNKPFPLITDALPSTLDSTMITELPQRVSMNPSSYQNALQWMNASLSAAHQEMEAMKKSPEGFDVMDKYQLIEGFDNCAQYSKCMDIYNEQQLEKEKEKIQVLENKLDNINNNSMIQSEAKKNIALIQKSKEIEAQAKSGDLLNQFELSNDDSSPSLVKPSGVDKLANMKKNNPKEYAKNEKNNGQMLGLGTLLNSISNTLR
jgi:hypothetical protein|uniref:Uncharacterized protein n=1 Tax=viral metagenome TaxID=1070528 RepID=A0A6C0BJ41_9ZZZZ